MIVSNCIGSRPPAGIVGKQNHTGYGLYPMYIFMQLFLKNFCQLTDRYSTFLRKNLNKLVRLVDFSLGGFYVVSESKPSRDEINISVKFGNSGRIDLVGSVVRVKGEGDMWGIAIDVSKNYNLQTHKEV